MAEFTYNDTQNVNPGDTPFELNCGFHPRVFCKEDVDSRSRSKAVDELATKPRKLTTVCRQDLQHGQEFQKQYYNKPTKPRNYSPGRKVWLNSKYIKTKQNRKLEAKFFGSFRVLHPVRKQTYKLKLPKRWRIHDVFHL